MNRDKTEHRRVRSARGEKRRAEIIEATLAVITRDGASGVTHRTVAKQAGISTSLSVYYFDSLDDLLVAALSTVADAYTARIREIIDSPGDNLRGLAELIVGCAAEGRERALAERELCTLAARRPALAPLAARWRQEIGELVATVADSPDAITAATVAADGLSTAVQLGTVPAETDHVHRILRKAIGHDGSTPTK